MSTYISNPGRGAGYGPKTSATDWHALTWDRLSSQYGPNRADTIMAGRDPKTQADLSAWRNLGRGRDAA